MRGRGIIKNTVLSAVSVTSGGGTQTSSAFTGIAGGEDMALFVQATGAGGDLTVEILTTEDGANFCVPETGGEIITGVTDELLHHAAIRIPICSGYKIRVTNDGASTVTVTAKVLSL